MRLLLAIPIFAFLTIACIGLSAGAAGDVVLESEHASLPAADGTDSTIYIPLSINDHPMQTIFGYEYSSIGTSHGLIEMHDAGANWVRRAGIWWPDVEPTKGAYNWAALSGFETEFLQANSKNMNVSVIVRGTPSWAQADPPYDRDCGRIKTTEFASFAAFMAELVNRYSYAPFNVMYWELYNEPDVDPTLVPMGNEWMGCWGQIGSPNYGGEYYAEMLKVVYPAMKAANPNAQVMIGGLLMDCDPINIQPSCSDPTTSKFIDGILAGGGGPFFDGISFHAYEDNHSWLGGYTWPGWAVEETTGPSVGPKAQYLKSVLSNYGVTGKFLMNTESALRCVNGDLNVCETTKAYYVVHAFATALKEGLRSNIWYFWYARNSELLEADLTPLPAYYTYEFAREQFKYATYSQEITDYANVRCYEFNVPGGTMWVMWSLDLADHNGLVLPGPVPSAVYDSDGDSIVPAGTIDIGIEPMYVEWVSP